MDRRKLLGFLGFTAAASAVGATNVSAKSYTSLPEPKGEPVVPMPLGMILAWAGKPGDQLMPNWMLCDGRRLSAREYPALHKVIGKLFGSDSADPDIFMLPDMRPRFDLTHMGPAVYGTHEHRFIADDVPAHVHSVGPTHQHTMHDAWVTGRSLGNGEYEAVRAHHNVPPQPTLAIQHIMRVR